MDFLPIYKNLLMSYRGETGGASISKASVLKLIEDLTNANLPIS